MISYLRRPNTYDKETVKMFQKAYGKIVRINGRNLQGMINLLTPNITGGVTLDDWVKGDYGKRFFIDCSIEAGHLAFIMEMAHNKVWNGEEWVSKI